MPGRIKIYTEKDILKFELLLTKNKESDELYIYISVMRYASNSVKSYKTLSKKYERSQRSCS